MIFALKIDKIIDSILPQIQHFYFKKRLCLCACVCVCVCCVCVVCVGVFCPLSRKVILNQTGKEETVTQAQGLKHRFVVLRLYCQLKVVPEGTLLP